MLGGLKALLARLLVPVVLVVVELPAAAQYASSPALLAVPAAETITVPSAFCKLLNRSELQPAAGTGAAGGGCSGG
jgi:hypothetical protein